MKIEQGAYQRKVDAVAEQRADQTFRQCFSPFSGNQYAEELDRFVKDDADRPDYRAKICYDGGGGKYCGEQKLQYKVARRDRVPAVCAGAAAEKIGKDRDLLAQGELTAAGFAETLGISH